MLSKYQPLVDYLIAHRDAEEIILTFGEIEAIIGVTLPMAMRGDTSVWNGVYHGYMCVWQAAGWVATLDRRHRRVRFTRDGVGG